MQAIREIREVVSEEITVKIPKDFLEKKIEIIILPIDDFYTEAPSHKDDDNLDQEIDVLSWDMGEKLYTTRDQLHE
jgi:division protein CdvB (Snf7/Vps24/ESCRT-III family)